MSKPVVAFGLLIFTASCLFGGCVDNDKSFTIVGIVAPDSGCTWQVDPDQWWARGMLDLSVLAEPTYVLVPQVHNNMPTTGDPANEELDAMAVLVQTATVNYRWLYGSDVVERSYGELLLLEDMEETIYMAAMVDSASEAGSGPGKLVVGFEAMPEQVGRQLVGLGSDADDLVLGLVVTLHGTTLGGTEVSSNEFVFPVYLCWGCLAVECCSGTPEAYYPGSCLPGQDMVLPCECETSP